MCTGKSGYVISIHSTLADSIDGWKTIPAFTQQFFPSRNRIPAEFKEQLNTNKFGLSVFWSFYHFDSKNSRYGKIRPSHTLPQVSLKSFLLASLYVFFLTFAFHTRYFSRVKSREVLYFFEKTILKVQSRLQGWENKTNVCEFKTDKLQYQARNCSSSASIIIFPKLNLPRKNYNFQRTST